MEKFKDINLISCILVLVVFTFGYFFAVNKLSYAFEDNYDLEKSHKDKIFIIEECAKKYGELNNELFKEDTIYIKVSDLIAADLIAPNHDGNIIDNFSGKNLNDSVIKIKYEDKKYSVEVNV